MITTLEKVRRLEQYIAVDNSTVDPVLDTTINKLLIRERTRVLELKERLLGQCKQFEETYALNSTDFYAQYESGEIGDKMDFVEWAATVEMLANVKKRLTLLDTESAEWDNAPHYPNLPNAPHHIHDEDGSVQGMTIVPTIFSVIDRIESHAASLST